MPSETVYHWYVIPAPTGPVAFRVVLRPSSISEETGETETAGLTVIAGSVWVMGVALQLV
jgi:hypothetical protein